MRVALAAEECAGRAPLWKLAWAENVCNVGYRRGRNGSAGLDGCCKEGQQTSSQINAGDDDSLYGMRETGV